MHKQKTQPTNRPMTFTEFQLMLQQPKLSEFSYAEGWWKTKDGAVLHATRMDTDHLLAIKAMLLTRAESAIRVQLDSALFGVGGDMGLMTKEMAEEIEQNLQQWIFNKAAEHPFWKPLTTVLESRSVAGLIVSLTQGEDRK